MVVCVCFFFGVLYVSPHLHFPHSFATQLVALHVTSSMDVCWSVYFVSYIASCMGSEGLTPRKPRAGLDTASFADILVCHSVSNALLFVWVPAVNSHSELSAVVSKQAEDGHHHTPVCQPGG